MWTVVFMITTVICGIGWLNRYVNVLMLIYFIEIKGYAQPTEQEIKECTAWVVKRWSRS